MQDRIAVIQRIRKMNPELEEMARVNYLYFIERTEVVSGEYYDLCLPTLIQLREAVAHVAQAEPLITNLEQAVNEVSEALKIVCVNKTKDSIVAIDDALCVIADDQFKLLTDHLDVRANKRLDILPAVDYQDAINTMEYGMSLLLAYAPTKFDNPKLEQLFKSTGHLITDRMKLVGECIDNYKKLEIELPKQKKAYQDCREKLRKASEKVGDLLKSPVLAAPQVLFPPKRKKEIIEGQKPAPAATCCLVM